MRSRSTPQPQSATVPVWDPFVRVAHWFLAAGVLVAYVTGDHGGTWHERLGYGVLALVALRFLWGFVGPRHARFGDFVASPREVLSHARAMSSFRERRFLGHNPLGGWNIVAMLALVVLAGASGWALAEIGEETRLGEAVEEAHEVFAGTLLALAALHIAGVAWGSVRHGENLVRAMFTGRKRAPRAGDS